MLKKLNNASIRKKRKYGKRKYGQEEKTIRQEKSYNILKTLPNLPLKSFIKKTSNVLRRIGTFIVSETVGFLSFVLGVSLFPLKILKFPFRKRKNKVGRPRKHGQSSSIFIKSKYIILGCIVSLFLFFLPLAFYIFASDLPDLSNINFDNIPKSTKIFDRNGILLYEIYANQNRTIVPLEKIPQDLVEATIAIEDKDFYQHPGFDLKAMIRAFYMNIKNEKTQGGSTITQQLIKSALLTPEATITRKAKELVLAIWAERKYSKDQILEFYFNYIPYGGTAWGVEAASNIYFNKDVSSLSLAESAYLAGLPQAPGEYNPFVNDGKNGKRRQREVLNAMVSEGYISRSEADQAYKDELKFKSPDIHIKAPHFVMYVKDLLIKEYGIYEVEKGGLQVTTSLDLKTQEEAQKIVAEEVEKSRYLGVGNGSALVANPQNGEIYVMVGSRDYYDSENDGNVNLTTALRQPGSTIKVIPYTLALTRGFTEATILDDTPLTINTPGSPAYTPVNYDGRYHGRIPLRLAFANSFNIPAVRVAQKLGVGDIVDFGRKMGITSWKDPSNYGVSIALGAAEVSMIDLVTSYSVIANSGQKVTPNPILEIKNSKGEQVYKKEVVEEKVVDKGVAFIISDILADNRARSIAFGPNTPLVIPNHKVSVKTGTTDNKRDNWTVGFTSDLIVGTWVGNNDNTPLSPFLASGITGAAPMWNRIMIKMLEGKTSQSVSIPDDVIGVRCYGYEAYFIKGTETNQCRVPFNVSSTPPPNEPNLENRNDNNGGFWNRIFRAN